MPGLSARSQVANSHPEQGHAGQAWEQACREGGGEGGLGQARLQACREDGGGVYMGMGGGGEPAGHGFVATADVCMYYKPGEGPALHPG